MINENDCLSGVFTNLDGYVENANSIFKVFRLKNKFLHLLFFSFTRSWIINTRWSVKLYAVGVVEV